ncbi:breast carcinoma-amplified sequence 3 protein rudhira [Haematobia irritans]|uniref:breast carcinoma-amplified sequence 3 protein rudhira n=1 Tax=Haematobia irritans TaxID=7368 RepID=UPI003F4FDE14
MSADSPRRSSGNSSRGLVAVPSIVPPQVVSDRSILDSAIGFINEVTLAHQPHTDPKDTITWARFETAADISDPRFGEDWELDGNVAPPLLLILGYGLGVQVWAIPANGEAVEVLSWRHGIVSALRVLPTPSASGAIEENGRADEPIDVFADKRPLIALVDGSSSSGSQPQFCAVNFISLKTGTQVKAIKFKNPVIDVLANRSSIAITFHERIAVFDARTLEDRLSITTCYPSPGINPNPIALGPRWLAYAEHKLLHSKRSGGGCDGEGVASYTATVLNASKSLVKGLRELGEQVAAGLTGTTGSTSGSKNPSFDSGMGPDSKQSGIVTIIDIKNPLRDYSPTSGIPMSSSQSAGTDPIVAHFLAHSEALVAMEFDNSGMLLVTADRRGHDFHVFRIQPNPVGSSLAAVHHLYVLHRGDTSAKVQNIAFSLDSRWVAVSTLRGTTHVFPITPYGGPMGVRTHTSLHVVNKLSRFHRSAGLSAEGRSNSPITHSESTTFSLSLQPYHNPTLPPYPRPTVVMPLAQLRQPFALGSPPGSATIASGKSGAGSQGSGSQRQRLSSLSDDSGKPLSVCAIFAKSRSWLLDPPNVTREAPHRMQRKAVDSLFVMAGHGALIQYDLDTKLASNVAKEKICDDTPIELEVEAKAQWNLGRRKEGSQEITPPLSLDNWLVKNRNSCMLTDSTRQYDDSDDRGDSWLAQVEIVTHAGPHRRLWMGPQFVFKTYNTPSGSNLSHVDIEAVEIGTNKATTSTTKPDHTSPLNMPLTAAGRSSAVPVLIESGSYSSIEQSPKLMDRFRHDHLDSDYSVAHGDTRLKEDLADAMRESPSVSATSKESGGSRVSETGCSSDNIAFYDALAEHDDQDQDSDFLHDRNASAAALASALPNIYSYDNSSSYESMDSLKPKPNVSIEKIVNPLGTVTTVTSCLTAEVKKDILDEVVSQLAAEDTVIHENCDESLFRPVVAIFCDEKTRLKQEEEARKNLELCQPPENISNKLIVPVIAKEVDDALTMKEKQKSMNKFKSKSGAGDVVGQEQLKKEREQQSKFDELSLLNKKIREEKEEVRNTESKEQISSLAENKGKLPLKENKEQSKPKIEEETTRMSESKMEAKVKSVKANETKEKLKEKAKSDIETIKHKENKISPAAKKEEIYPSSGQTSKLSQQEKETNNIKELESKQDNEKLDTKTTGEESDIKPNSKKERQKKSEEKELVEKVQMKGQKKEEMVKTNRSSEEKEKSPKPCSSSASSSINKKGSKASFTDDSEDDKPMEFIRMTPTTEKTASAQKPLSKKELKKQQQQQKAKEAEEARLNELEKSKKKSEKEIPTKAGEEVTTMTQTKVEEPTTTKSNLKEEKSLEKKLPNKDSMKTEEKCSTIKNQIQDEVNTITDAAPKIKISAIDKTAISDEIEKDLPSTKSAKENDDTSPAKKETKSLIKTEQLNVKELTDSLLELKNDDEIVDENQEKKVENISTPPLESVEVFTAPSVSSGPSKTASKKKNKKGNKSGSSSENEEIVEITKPTQSSKQAKCNKKSSISSEDSYPDLADSLLDKKEQEDMEETMYVSFTQTKERRKSSEKVEETKSKEDSEAKQAKNKDPTEKKVESLPKAQPENVKLTKNEIPEKSSGKINKNEEKIPQKDKQTKESEENQEPKEYKVIVKEEQIAKKEETLKSKEKAISKVEEKCDEEKTMKKSMDKKVKQGVNPAIDGEGSDKEKSSKSNKSESQKEKSMKDNKTAEAPTQEKSGEDALKQTKEKIVDSDENDKEKHTKMSETDESDKQKTTKGNKGKTSLKEDDESDKEKISKENIKGNQEFSQDKSPQSKKFEQSFEEKDVKATKDEESNKSKNKSIEKDENTAESKKDKMVTKNSLDKLKENDDRDKEKSAKNKKENVNEKQEDMKPISKNMKPKPFEDERPRNETVAVKDIKENVKTKSDKSPIVSLDKKKSEEESKENTKIEIKSKPFESQDDMKIKKPKAQESQENLSSKVASKQEVIVEQPKIQAKEKKEELQKQIEALEKETSLKEPSEVEGEKAKKAQSSSVETTSKDAMKTKTTPPSSPKKKQEKMSKTKSEENPGGKPAVKKEELEVLKQIASANEDSKKPGGASISKQDKSDVEEPPKEFKVKIIESQSQDTPTEGSKTPKVAGSPKKSSNIVSASPPTPAPAPVTSAWKTLSGAEMIAQNLQKQETKIDKSMYPSLGGAIAKSTPKTSGNSEKLLPELPTPKEDVKDVSKTPTKKSKTPSTSSALDDFPILKPLDALPPLPSLQPLELISEANRRASDTMPKDVSLINFESPLQENPALERKITPPPRGFTEQNLIFALCGSLHYENEQRSRLTPEKSDVSPTTPSSSNRSSSALDEPSMADYKSLTENDDPYISLEQSSQDTYTTNTNTTNDKFSSSTNSSGTEEIIIMEEKKMTKKQKRKRQQQLLEIQKQKEQQLQQHHHNPTEMDDDELRPLIAMSESQIENVACSNSSVLPPSLLDESFSMKPLIAKSNTLTHSTTTDSEGPMPATTSDDNVFIMPATSSGQHKIKTKKLEHKINLMAAIEAATSSSTSSAEESGVELGGGRCHDADDEPPNLLGSVSLISGASVGSAASISSPNILPMSMAAVVAAGGSGNTPIMTLNSSNTVGALKKKTKRRKR